MPRGSTAHQIKKSGYAVAIQVNDFTVENSVMDFQGGPETRREIGERFEDVPVARDQPRRAVFKVRQGAKAIVFQFKDPVAVIEGRARGMGVILGSLEGVNYFQSSAAVVDPSSVGATVARAART